jgi:hypothetical protein
LAWASSRRGAPRASPRPGLHRSAASPADCPARPVWPWRRARHAPETTVA